MPRALRGESTWTNSVVACMSCNARKGHRTLEAASMDLLRAPKEPPPYGYQVRAVETASMRVMRTVAG